MRQEEEGGGGEDGAVAQLSDQTPVPPDAPWEAFEAGADVRNVSAAIGTSGRSSRRFGGGLWRCDWRRSESFPVAKGALPMSR